jgi:hypothetical protein
MGDRIILPSRRIESSRGCSHGAMPCLALIINLPKIISPFFMETAGYNE